MWHTTFKLKKDENHKLISCLQATIINIKHARHEDKEMQKFVHLL